MVVGFTDSTYVYRVSAPAVRALQVFDHLGAELTDLAIVTPFPGLLLDTSESFTFRLSNAGALDVDIQSVTLGGTDAGQFGIGLPDISSPSDLAGNESIDYTISFNPTGSSALRVASVLINSNDPGTPVFSFTISGLGLSNTADSDGDGMNDWGEYSLRGFGFDWEKTQSNKVADFYDLASTAGLADVSEMGAVNGSGVLVDVDLQTNTAALVIALEDSTDLSTFTPITIDPAKLSVDADGNIRYEVDAPEGKKFYRAGFKP